jgi:hypothetical protein
LFFADKGTFYYADTQRANNVLRLLGFYQLPGQRRALVPQVG